MTLLGNSHRYNMMKKALLIITIILITFVVIARSQNISFNTVSMLLNVMTGRGIDSPETETVGSRLQVPNGFSVDVYARNLPNARFITMTANGDLLTTRPHKGDVVMIRAGATPTQSGERLTLLTELTRPSGIAVHQGWLYIGEADSVGRIAFNETTGEIHGQYQKIINGLIGITQH